MASIDNEQIIIDFQTNAASTVADMAKVKGQIDELKEGSEGTSGYKEAERFSHRG